MVRVTLVLLLLLLPATGFAAVINRTVAVVNDEIVTSYQLDRALATKSGEGAAVSATVRREMLDKMVEELLLGQRVKALQLSVADEEIDAAIDDILKQNKLTITQLKQALVQQGIEFATYRETLSKQLLRYKLMGREVQAKVEVTNREIRSYFDEHVADYRRPPQVRVEHFSLKGEGAADRMLIAGVRTRLDGGEPLAQVLASFAGDERIFGGEMGRFKEGELAPVFADAIAGLPVGGVSEVVAQNEMLHLLIVAEQIPGGVVPLDEVKDKIEAQLREEKAQARFKEWLAELKENAYIVIQLDGDGAEVPAAE